MPGASRREEAGGDKQAVARGAAWSKNRTRREWSRRAREDAALEELRLVRAREEDEARDRREKSSRDMQWRAWAGGASGRKQVAVERELREHGQEEPVVEDKWQFERELRKIKSIMKMMRQEDDETRLARKVKESESSGEPKAGAKGR